MVKARRDEMASLPRGDAGRNDLVSLYLDREGSWLLNVM
jgi:hypothetical protein